MPEPEPLSPFQHRDAPATLLRSLDLQIEERAFVAKLSIRGRATDAAFALRFRDGLGIDPPPAGTAVAAEAAIILPVGPTEWLAVGHQPEPAPSRSDRLRARLTNAGLIAVDVSSGMTILRAAGGGLHPTLRKLAAVSLARMPAWHVARTRIGKLPILVHTLASDQVDLFVARSFARSFFEQLQDASGITP